MNKNLSMDALRSFVTISELGSFTKAGQRLARSQPAISLQIKKLEQLMGRKLFVRKGHDFELTDPGIRLLDYAKQLLELNDQAINDMGQPQVTGQVKLGIPSEFATALLPKIVKAFSRENPGVTLEVICDLSTHLTQGLTQGNDRFDVIVTLIDQPEKNTSRTMKQDRLVWTAAAHYRVPDSGSIPLIMAPVGCMYRQRAIDRLNGAGIDWHVVYTIMDLSGITSAIEEGLGVTVLAESTQPAHLKSIQLRKPIAALGHVGIDVISSPSSSNEATQLLVDYLQRELGMNRQAE